MFKRLFFSTDLFRNISTLVVGTFVAQLVPVLLQSILRRIYPAEDFGVFAVFISITGIIMVIASLRYEVAIVLPEKKADAINLVFAGIWITLIFSLLLLVLIFFFENQFLNFLNIDSHYAFMLWYLPPTIFLFSTYQVINYYLVRYKAYKAISINKISRRVSEGIVQVAMGVTGRYSTGLIWGNLIGHVINVAAGWVQMVKGGFTTRLFSFRRQKELVTAYKEYPLYNMVPAFLNALCLHLPLIFINKFYTQEDTAYFDLARQVLILPASILTLSISQVMLQSISEKKRLGQSFKTDLRKIIYILAALALVMVVAILAAGPLLFAVYAGDQYAMSGYFARIIVAGAALKLLVSPLSSIFVPLDRIKLLSLWQALYFIAIAFLFLIRDYDIMTFLKIYLVIDLVSYGILFVMIIRLSHGYERRLAAKNKNKNLQQ